MKSKGSLRASWRLEIPDCRVRVPSEMGAKTGCPFETRRRCAYGTSHCAARDSRCDRWRRSGGIEAWEQRAATQMRRQIMARPMLTAGTSAPAILLGMLYHVWASTFAQRPSRMRCLVTQNGHIANFYWRTGARRRHRRHRGMSPGVNSAVSRSVTILPCLGPPPHCAAPSNGADPNLVGRAEEEAASWEAGRT